MKNAGLRNRQKLAIRNDLGADSMGVKYDSNIGIAIRNLA
jgi:hypothetical protein